MIIHRTYRAHCARYIPNLDDTHICKQMHGHTFNITIFLDGPINDKSGFLGINMQGTMPDNNLHVKGDRPLTLENTNQSSGTAGIIFKDNRSDQNFTIGSTNLGFFIKDDNKENLKGLKLLFEGINFEIYTQLP